MRTWIFWNRPSVEYYFYLRMAGQSEQVNKKAGRAVSDGTVGVNPDDAHAGGSASAEAAARLRDLPADFDEAIQAAKSAVRPTPGITGWDSFGSDHEQHMVDVKEHARTLAENIQDGAYEAAITDLEAAEEFSIPINGPQFY